MGHLSTVHCHDQLRHFIGVVHGMVENCLPNHLLFPISPVGSKAENLAPSENTTLRMTEKWLLNNSTIIKSFDCICKQTLHPCVADKL